jgi:hypothetical protein
VGAINQKATVTLYTAAGVPAPGLSLHTLGASINYKPQGGTVVAILLTGAPTPNYLSRGDGAYDINVPDAAYSAACPRLEIGGTLAGHVIIPDIQQVIEPLALQSTLGDVKTKTDTIGTVDLTPVTDQLDDIETTLGEIQAKTDTIGTVDLGPVTEQLDDIETTLATIQDKTDTIEPPSSGPHRLTITALDAGDQVGGAIVRIVGVAGTLRTTTTDAPTLIDLDPGDYSLRVVSPSGFAPIADIPVNDLDADRTITIPLTRTAIAPPAAGNLCAVALRVATASDTPLAAASVTAYLVTGPAIGNTLHNGPTAITTDANGLATLQLLRGQTYDITATATVGGVTATVTARRIIPNASTANFGTLVAG